MPFSPDAARAFMSPSSTALNGCFVFHSGCSGASAFTRASAKANWTLIGCSAQSVPSLSKVAMRCSGGTNRGLARSVTVSMNVKMLCLAVPSFHEGNGSVCAPTVPSNPIRTITPIKPRMRAARTRTNDGR
jgi:hypothetical protein